MKNSLDRLKGARLRVTNCRVCILQAIEQCPKKRLRVEDIFRQLASSDTPISLGSVYRVLRELTQDGILRRTWDGDGGEPRYLYQMALEDEAPASVRMTCVHCARHVVPDQGELGGMISQAGHLAGLDVSAMAVDIRVTCRRCAEMLVNNKPVAAPNGRRAGKR